MPTAIRAWACEICGAEAGSISVDEQGEVLRASFVSTLTCGMGPAAADLLRSALVAGNAAAVHALDPELAAWWCPECQKSYCGSHWQRWDVFEEDEPNWRDSIRSRCPAGHERLLED